MNEAVDEKDLEGRLAAIRVPATWPPAVRLILLFATVSGVVFCVTSGLVWLASTSAPALFLAAAHAVVACAVAHPILSFALWIGAAAVAAAKPFFFEMVVFVPIVVLAFYAAG